MGAREKLIDEAVRIVADRWNESFGHGRLHCLEIMATMPDSAVKGVRVEFLRLAAA